MIAGNRFQKPVKTKFRKAEEFDGKEGKKSKHHDKSYYRLLKQEQEDYQNTYGSSEND